VLPARVPERPEPGRCGSDPQWCSVPCLPTGSHHAARRTARR
jgi:hypothetical protein